METLLQLLIACESLLRKVGEIFWADKISHTIKRNNDDLYLLQEIISWYGGMGSFNDLLISIYNDYSIDIDSEDEINGELSVLRSKIYQEAVRLQRNSRGTILNSN